MNTLIIAIIVCIISTLFVLAVSYCMSRLRFKMRKKYMNIAMILGLFPGFMSMIAVYYILKAVGLSVIIRVRTADNLCKNEIQPRSQKRCEYGIDNNWFTKRNCNFRKHLELSCSVKECRLVKRLWNRVEKSLADILRVSFDRRRSPDAVRVEVGHWRRIFALRRELV